MKNTRTALGISVMTIVPLLQLGTEYLGTGDRGRALSKLMVTLIGLPILLWGSSRGLRWAGGRRVGPLLLLAGGMLSAGTLYALLLDAEGGNLGEGRGFHEPHLAIERLDMNVAGAFHVRIFDDLAAESNDRAGVSIDHPSGRIFGSSRHNHYGVFPGASRRPT